MIGVLTLDEAKREGLTVTARRYAVFELTPDKEGNRRFRVNKPGEPLTPYFVLLRGGENRDQCTCTGCLKGGFCAHIDALRSHERAGHLPRPTMKVLNTTGV